MFDPVRQTFTNVTQLQTAMLAQNVGVLIEDGFYIKTYEDFLVAYNLSTDSTLAFITNQQVYTIDRTQSPNGGNDWFESLLAEADMLLEGTLESLLLFFLVFFPKKRYD